MAVDVSAVLTVITGMVPGVIAVGVAWLTVQMAIDSFRYIRDALGYGAPDPNDPNDIRNYDHDVYAADEGDPYKNARVRAIHEENGWDPDWDSEPAPATGFPLPPAVVQAYADNNGLPPRG